MKTLTKKESAILFGYGYQITDGVGTFPIISVDSEEESFWINLNERTTEEVTFDQIGVDYWILARPLSDLTKEIEVNGEMFVPIDELRRKFASNITISAAEHGIGMWLNQKTPAELGIFAIAEIRDKLFEWHFALNLDKDWVKEIKE